MSSLLLKTNRLALWQALVQDAQNNSDIHLNEQLESYLVFLLMHFCDKPQIAHSVLALEFLETIETHHQNFWALKEFGDKCLLFAGLFPERASRKRLTLDYFVQLGQTAYHTLSQQTWKQEAILFEELEQTFVRLMDVLHATREKTDSGITADFLSLLTRWQQTGSEYAIQQLRQQHPTAVILDNSPKRMN